MENNKLYSILNHFNKYEQNRLRKYLQSPYFNKNESLVQLFEVFIDDINKQLKINEGKLSKNLVWEQLSPNTAYDDIRFRKLSSDLLKLVESFLAQQVYDANPLHKATYLIEAVSKKRIDKLYNSVMKTARRLSDYQSYKPANFYYYQYEIETNYYDLAEHQFKRHDRKNVEEITNNLDYFYMAEKLKYYCAILNQQNVVSHEYRLLFIEDIIGHIKNFDYKHIPPIAIYYQIFLTLAETENDSHYFNLKDLISKHILEFPVDEAKKIYESALNYCIRKINEGNQLFLSEYFNLYVDILQKELLHADGELAPLHFRNIITAALRLGNYDWTEGFINKYKEMLPSVFKENAVTFNLAQVYFYQKRYENVISLLQEVEYDDVVYNLSSKSILLATYYETNEIEPLYSLFDSFRVFLNRHKSIPPQRRKNYMNLIRFTKRLTKIIPGDQKAISKLNNDIEKEKSIASSNWLKEKIAELE